MAVNESLVASGNYGENARAPLSIAYAAGAAQDPILTPTSEVLAVLSFDAAGTASIEGTNSPHANVAAGTAVWKLWPSGIVGVTTDNICQGLTAVRVVRAAGTPRITLTMVDGNA